MDRICELINFVFDPLHYYWEHSKTQKVIAGILIAVFVFSLPSRFRLCREISACPVPEFAL